MEGLGINLKWLLFQLGNFLLLLVVLNYLLHKPVTKLLDDRRKEIDESLKAAERMREEVAQSEKNQEKILADARQEASALLADARRQAVEGGDRIMAQSKEQADSLLAQAKAQIDQERSQIKDSLREELGALVVKATEKALGEEISDSDKQSRIKGLVKDIS
jgi:F-type H+-transporting ATPase subunit b